MCAGVWIREIRMKTNLGIPQLNKLLKNMISKKLIKAVKSVAVSSLFFLSFVSVDINYIGHDFTILVRLFFPFVCMYIYILYIE